jgi:hypothetical protein
MKRLLPLFPLLLAGCATTTSFVKSDNTTLGRVVVYRNGVAYFERTAEVSTDVLRIAVPGDKIDDFLKSLTVTDLSTGLPAPVGFPNTGPTGDGLTQMQIHLSGAAPHKLQLTYVTEAPSWKPSYRVVLGKDKKVEFQGWAVVDNTSGEDWEKVKLGVGSSSALSFRFDLRSVRTVQRETLHSNDLFAQAPPMGGAAYGAPQAAPRVVSEMSDEVIAQNAVPAPQPIVSGMHAKAAPAEASARSGDKKAKSTATAAAPRAMFRDEPPPPPGGDVAALANRLRSSQNQIVVEGYADDNERDKSGASLARANKVREQLINNGVDPSRVVAVAQGAQAGRKAGVRIVEAPVVKKEEQQKEGKTAPEILEPIGTSHFESPTSMSIARGTSAMISIFKTSAEGEVVYVYDPESARGNAQFAFKAVRVRNPTDSVLESGPVTVFGEGRFIGEGLADPIPAKSVAFVPFALDRQITVEVKDAERDDISRIFAVQRGVMQTRVQHVRKVSYKLFNRMDEPAVVYVRHTVRPGYELVKPKATEKLGAASLFRMPIPAHASVDFVLEESTPVERTVDIRSPSDMSAVRAYLTSDRAEEPLKTQLSALTKLQQDIGNDEQRIQTVREQMDAYRVRTDELHAQIVTLRMVKTGGAIMKSLEKKLQEMSDRLSKATIDLASLEEAILLKRIKLQDGIAELTIDKPAAE